MRGVSRRGLIVDRGVRAAGVVVGRLGSELLASAVQAEEQALVQQLVAHPAVEGFHEAVLGGLARRDVVPGDAVILGPSQDGGGGELCAVVADDHAGAAAAGDQSRQLPGHPAA